MSSISLLYPVSQL